MKQLKRRTIFVLVFALLLAAGVAVFCVRWAIQGGKWAASPVNQAVYTSGRLTTGTVYDRNGVLLYDCATQTYGDSALLRTATLHLVGDPQGNIATGARKLFARQLVSWNPVTGVNTAGADLFLSVDASLNESAYRALNGRAGTVGIYNYRTGEVLCLVSSPSYDPIDENQAAAVAAGDAAYTGAYVNRFLSSTYTPGSTFKVVTAAAALENLDTDRFTYNCTGSMSVGADSVTCTAAHGEVDFASALAKSCNCAFATLAMELGGDTLKSYTEKAGLLSAVTVSGFESAVGNFDVAESGSLNLGWSGAGQYNDLVNPAAMLTLMGCIAEGGSAATPQLLRQDGVLSAGSTSSVGWKSSTCASLRSLMRNNVTTTYGQDQFGSLAVCAKSGTAEVGTENPHAWFVGFIDDETYPYAFVVLVENGGSGASVAGGIAATLLNELCAGDGA